MNFRLRQERNAFVFLVIVAVPVLLLTAPLPYLSALASYHTQQAGSGQSARPKQEKGRAKAKPKQSAQGHS